MPVDNEIAIKSTALSGEFKKPAIKYPRCIPNQDFQKVLKRINSLCENPGADGCVKLACQEGYKVS